MAMWNSKGKPEDKNNRKQRQGNGWYFGMRISDWGIETQNSRTTEKIRNL
jgi:hypothetical protein